MDLEEAKEIRKDTINITHSQYMTLYALAALGPLPADRHRETLTKMGLIADDMDRVRITDRGKLVIRDYHAMTVEKKHAIFEYDIDLIGIEDAQHFRGASRGGYAAKRVGIGETVAEAFEDAIEQLASEWTVETLPSAVSTLEGIELRHPHLKMSVRDYIREFDADPRDDHELHWYVVVRVK